MTLARLMVYAQSIEESKLWRITRNLKSCDSSDQGQPRFKRRAHTQDGPIAKVKLEKEGGPKRSNLLVQNVARNIMVSVYWVLGNALVMVKKDTR